MRKITLVLIISFSIACSAGEYHYTYHKSGMPMVRVIESTGRVEIYSNLHKIKITNGMLHNMHQEHYKNLPYKDYVQKLKQKFLNLEFKVEEDYRWQEYNEYLKTAKLKEFSTSI